MKPKIVILSDFPLDLKKIEGGVQAATAGLLEGLSDYQNEFEFYILNVQNIPHDIFIESEGFHFHFLSLPLKLRPRMPFRVLSMVRHLKKISPDLVHCEGSLDIALAGIWSHYPGLFTVHGVRRQEAKFRYGWERLASIVDAFIEPYIYSRFNNFICVSDYIKRIISKNKQTFSIPNAVRSAFFSIARHYSPEKPLLLFVGNLSPLKGPENLITAHNILRRQFPNLQTVFCGLFETPSYQKHLQTLSGEGIKFAGLVNEVGLKHWLSIATVLVLPSRQENAPIVISEAMAAGVPVVATHVGGIPEMVEDGKTGFIFIPGDVDALSMYLERLLKFPLLAEQLGAQGKILALNRYHPDQVARQTVDVYRKLLSNSNISGDYE